MDDEDDWPHGAHFDCLDAELENPLENPHCTPASPVSDGNAEDHNGTSADDNDDELLPCLAHFGQGMQMRRYWRITVNR